jgi:hypothetical protein
MNKINDKIQESTNSQPIYFNLENELNKIKVPIPLIELVNNPMYKDELEKLSRTLSL